MGKLQRHDKGEVNRNTARQEKACKYMEKLACCKVRCHHRKGQDLYIHPQHCTKTGCRFFEEVNSDVE